MLTHSQIAAMSGPERTQLFDQLAATVFRTQAEICAALGVQSLRTLQNWRGAQDVPQMAVLAMQSIAAAPNQPKALLEDARHMAGKIETIADELAQLSRTVAGMVRRLPDPS